MLLNVALRRVPLAARLLLWCALGAVLAQAVLARLGPDSARGFSPIFHYLLRAYDTHGNALLLALAVCAFLLRRQSGALALIEFAAAHPWRIAAAAFPLFCLGSLQVYRDYPLSMDEYQAVFQAQIFAAGKLTGQFPPELVDHLVPQFVQRHFVTVSHASGAIAANYWPGFALLLTPFAWLGIPWAANPALSALSLPLLHRLAREMTGSREAAGWTVALTLASPVFVVSAISYYAMPAHLLCNALYALLLLRPTVPRALLAGLVGSLALTLHNPVPHLLFALPFLAWMLFRGGSAAMLGALVLGYLPLAALLGLGWRQHLADISAAASTAAAGTAAATAAVAPVLERALSQVMALITLPRAIIVEARIAGLSKAWTWAAAALPVLAVYGFAMARERTPVKLLAAALALTFLAYFFVPFDQGHGWGNRYIHSAWFALPVLAAIALSEPRAEEWAQWRNMASWAIVLSLLFANALRLVQVDAFMSRHLNQVPPLARPADPQRPEVLFVNPAAGFYAQDMVHNDPFLRGPRITLVHFGRAQSAELMARRFPGYTKSADGKWGELWTAARPAGGRQ
jgi:hypothetical protein